MTGSPCSIAGKFAGRLQRRDPLTNRHVRIAPGDKENGALVRVRGQWRRQGCGHNTNRHELQTTRSACEHMHLRHITEDVLPCRQQRWKNTSTSAGAVGVTLFSVSASSELIQAAMWSSNHSYVAGKPRARPYLVAQMSFLSSNSFSCAPARQQGLRDQAN